MSNKKKFLTVLAIITLTGAVLLRPVVSQATTSSYSSQSINDLQTQKAQLEKIANQKKAAASDQADTAAAAKAKIADLDKSIAAAQSQIQQTDNNITDTQNNINDLTQQIADHETSIEQKKANVAATLRQFFKLQVAQEHAGVIAIAFSKEGISKKIRDLQGYSAMKRELQRQQADLETEKQQLADNKSALEDKKSSLESYKTQKEIQKQDLAVQQDQQAKLKSNAEVAYAQLKQEEKDALSKEAEVEAIITQKIQAQLRGGGLKAGGAGTPVSQGQIIGHLGSTGYSTGPHVHFSVFTSSGATVNPRTRLGSVYIWPVTDYHITQEYGPANWKNPVYSFHNGIDLAGPAGQAVYAAADGKIVLDQYYGGYGNAVVIQHDDDWLTLYGHMTGN